MLIVVEGVDGAGKTTQTNALVNWLRSDLNRIVITIDFPGYERSPFGRMIGHFLRGEYGDPVATDPFQTALLYAADRMHSKESLQAALRDGAIVVLNRYVPSNLAYGCAKLVRLGRAQERDQLVTFNEQLEYQLAGLPRPDAVVVLSVHPNTASQMIGTKDARQYLAGEERDQYESDLQLQQAVDVEYKRLAATNPHDWHVIEACDPTTHKPRPIETVHQDIKSALSGLF